MNLQISARALTHQVRRSEFSALTPKKDKMLQKHTTEKNYVKAPSLSQVSFIWTEHWWTNRSPLTDIFNRRNEYARQPKFIIQTNDVSVGTGQGMPHNLQAAITQHAVLLAGPESEHSLNCYVIHIPPPPPNQLENLPPQELFLSCSFASRFPPTGMFRAQLSA
jgi:hypothetical protein